MTLKCCPNHLYGWRIQQFGKSISYSCIDLCPSLRWAVHNFIQLWVFIWWTKSEALFTWLPTFTSSQFFFSSTFQLEPTLPYQSIWIVYVEFTLKVVGKVPSNWVFWTRGGMAKVLRASFPHSLVFSLPPRLFPLCWHDLWEKDPLIQTA